MRKKAVVACIIILVCVFCVGSVIVYATASEGSNDFFLAGLFFKSSQNKESAGINSNVRIVAKYNGTAITADTVEYQKNMNILRDNESTDQNDTDLEIINNIIKSMILLEEAERRGLTATEAEVEALLQNARDAYATPEGKEILDSFCDGAGITIDEYFTIYRDQLPKTIARQKLRDEIGRQYCQEHGLEFTKVNPPAEMVAAQEAFIENLFEQNKDKIEYFLNDTVTS